MSFNRRDFLRASLVGGGSAALLGTLGRLGARAALAAGAGTPYKALVCVFLYGGNDANNMLIPADGTNTSGGYGNYFATRNPTVCDFSIPQSSLLTFVPTKVGGVANTKPYGVQSVMPNTQTLMNSKNLAFLCDVGTLVGPATAPFTGTAPENLFSHQDQQREWQGQVANPTGIPTTGWGGALGASLPQSATFPTTMSVDEAALFVAGANLPFVTNGTSSASLGGSAVNQGYLQQIATLGDAGLVGPLVNTQNAMTNLALQGGPLLSAVAQDPPAGWGANVDWAPGGVQQKAGTLLDQLHMIAKTIYGNANPPAGQASLGVSRQVFFCALGGFDTHSGQAGAQPALLGQLDAALWAFYNAMENVGMGSAVTTFTMSDFARSFQPASQSGTDHAWGSHHLIMGDAVKGGQLYGLDPNTLLSTYAQGGSHSIYDVDTQAKGRWIPQTSVDQYAATLANWLTKDLPNGGTALLEEILPNLSLYGATGWPQLLTFI